MPATPPSPVARQTPTGRRIPEGFVSKITFTTQPALGIWEVKVKPPGMDGGEPIDISTQHNIKYHTLFPRVLRKMSEQTIVAGIDPDALPVLDTLINLMDTITVLFPDDSTRAYYGWLQKYEWTEMEIGGFPLINMTIMPSNYDQVAALEQGPVDTPAAGT